MSHDNGQQGQSDREEKEERERARESEVEWDTHSECIALFFEGFSICLYAWDGVKLEGRRRRRRGLDYKSQATGKMTNEDNSNKNKNNNYNSCNNCENNGEMNTRDKQKW